jgi:hypothetical protein
LSLGGLLRWGFFGSRGNGTRFGAGIVDGGGGGITLPQTNVGIFNLKLGLGVDIRMEPGRGVRECWKMAGKTDCTSTAPNDALGAVDLHAVTRDFAQRLYFNIAAPVRASNSTAVPGESDWGS